MANDLEGIPNVDLTPVLKDLQERGTSLIIMVQNVKDIFLQKNTMLMLVI